MALLIHDDCTACDACKPVCPADCIVPHPEFAETPEQLQAKYDSLHR